MFCNVLRFEEYIICQSTSFEHVKLSIYHSTRKVFV